MYFFCSYLVYSGFGASSYHWRYNIPELARQYHVYAIDLLGFGFSDKPIQDYDASVRITFLCIS